MLREELFEAKQYADSKKAALDNGDSFEEDFRKECWLPVLRKEIPLKAHVHRADDIQTAIRIAKLFDLNLTLDHCTEGHLIAEEIRKSGFPAIVGPSLASRNKTETQYMDFKTAGILHKAGVKEGNIIGANFSGSFPSLNLAVLSACKAMGVKCIYISSIGSSNYGANYPELTFPDMALKLTAKGLIDSPGAAFSVGGSDDIGSEMDQDIISGIVKRLKDNGLPQITANSYQDDLLLRQQLLESSGDISCFVNAGGNITSLGEGESSFYFGQGLLSSKIVPVTEKSGLIEIYRNKGIPVIHFLNLRRLTADYSLAYDPVVLPQKGTSALYKKPSYNRTASLFLLAAAAGLLLYGKYKP
jgi:poly-gamma-glutamate system protein